MGSSAVLRACHSVLVLAVWMGVLHPYLRYGDRGRLRNVSPPVIFVRIESNFFYNTQETQTQKMMDRNFEIRIL